MYFKNKDIQGGRGPKINIHTEFGSLEHIRSLDNFNPIKYFTGCSKRVCGYHESGMD